MDLAKQGSQVTVSRETSHRAGVKRRSQRYRKKGRAKKGAQPLPVFIYPA